MSEYSKEDIIKDYERSKTQEKKIDSLNENIEKLTGIMGKFLEMIPGEKKDGEKKDGDKSKIPTKIEDREKEKEGKKESEKSIISQFLGF